MIGSLPLRPLRSTSRLRALRAATLALLAAWGTTASLAAAPLERRVRIEWGGDVPRRWTGDVRVDGGRLERLQPLGDEIDEAGAVRLEGDAVIVAPRRPRMSDGCEVTIIGDKEAALRVTLAGAGSPPGPPLIVPIVELDRGEVRNPLDSVDAAVTVRRAPGDRLQLRLSRDHLVLSPGESLAFTVDAAAETAVDASLVAIDAVITPIASTTPIWRQQQQLDLTASTSTSWQAAAPRQEGAYRVAITLRRQANLARKLVPWERDPRLAERSFEFVVVDPAAGPTVLEPTTTPAATLDPFDPHWRLRLPQWKSGDILPALREPPPPGRGDLHFQEAAGRRWAVLAPAANDGSAAWRALALPRAEPHQPYLAEIEVPRGVAQNLTLSVVEPDAAVVADGSGRAWSAFSDPSLGPLEQSSTLAGDRELIRLRYWPRTATPLLLLANRWPDAPASFGEIRVQRWQTTAGPAIATAVEAPSRLCAAYVSSPAFWESLGTMSRSSEHAGPVSWSSVLAASQRLAQQVRAAGFNAAIVVVAADGASLAPLDGLGSSPRFDAAACAGDTADPVRKDVLEALLRVFDREGLQLIPALQLAAPLAELESLAARSSADDGIRWIGADGSDPAAAGKEPPEGFPLYNITHPHVQAAVAKLVERLVARYESHSSLAGVALQTSGRGFGLLPGLTWGMDDETWRRFAAATGRPRGEGGPERFRRRAESLAGPLRAEWAAWRQRELTAVYQRLAAAATRGGDDRLLVLCTEDLLAGQHAAWSTRQAVANRGAIDDAVLETGFDFPALDAINGLAALRPRRLAGAATSTERAGDERLNGAMNARGQSATGDLFYFPAQRMALLPATSRGPLGEVAEPWSLVPPSWRLGDDANSPFARAWGARDVGLWVEGAAQPLLLTSDADRRRRRIFAALPPPATHLRTDRRQPVVLRVYRTAAATFGLLLNESPWPARVRIDVAAGGHFAWRDLGAESGDAALVPPDDDSPQAAGEGPLDAARCWSETLPPYGFAARRYDGEKTVLGPPQVELPPEARASLARYVEQLQRRLQALADERPYGLLPDPGFELTAAASAGAWQPRIGAAGTVELDPDVAAAGQQSMRLTSADALGVAVQSSEIPLPNVGQLTLRLQARGENMDPGSRLLLWLEYDDGGVRRQRPGVLADASRLGPQWSQLELFVDDLPLAGGGPLRIQLHLAGPGTVWLDDVRAYDLRFPARERQEIVKRLMAAQAALEENQLVDCLRLVEGYGLQVLAEQVPLPPAATALAQTTAQSAEETSPTAAEPAGPRLSERLRGIIPRSWR